jgi:hypothetical protein
MPIEFSRHLTEIGYSEDRGATCSLDCQGTFKFQHNLDTDLKTTTVFPRVTIIESKANKGPALWVVDGLDVMQTPPEIVAAKVTMLNFVSLVVEMCPTFSQRNSLLGGLNRVSKQVEDIEAKMTKLEQLSPDEDDL